MHCTQSKQLLRNFQLGGGLDISLKESKKKRSMLVRSFSVVHTRREANSVTHTLAKVAFALFFFFFFFCN
jgi:hypothetical protein